MYRGRRSTYGRARRNAYGVRSFASARKNRERWVSSNRARGRGNFAHARKNRERWVPSRDASAGGFRHARKNRERWIPSNDADAGGSFTFNVSNLKVHIPEAPGGEPPVDPPVDPPVGESGVPGVGDGTHPYVSTDYQVTYPGADFDPGSTNPLTRGCPPYSHPDWPRECPQKMTFAWVESIFQPVLDEANVYRAAKGYDPLIFDPYLVLSAQRHATYMGDKWDEQYASPDGQMVVEHGGYAWHWEPDTGSFGNTNQARVVNTGRDSGGMFIPSEGVGNGGSTPMQGFCIQKSDYVDEANPGHFGPFYTNPDVKYIGWGIDKQHSNPGNTIQVWNYHTGPPGANAEPLDELWTYLPKFDCP